MIRKITHTVQELLGEFRKELSHHPLTVVLETTGTLVSMLAAAVLSLQLSGLVTVYILWLIGSITLSIASYYRKNLMWLLLSGFYLIMNLTGLVLLIF